MKLLDKYITIIREAKHNSGTKENADNTDNNQSVVDSTLQKLPSEKSTTIPTKAVKVYSNTLNDYVWIAPDDETAAVVRDTGTQDVVYTRSEIAQLKKTSDPEVLRQLHEIKKLFEKSRIVAVKKHESFNVAQCKDSPAPYGRCTRFTMKLGPDQTLWVYCLRGKVFCPNSVSTKGVRQDMSVSEKETAAR